MRPRSIAVVPAAGYGRRLGLEIKKPFVLLRGKPLISYALAVLDSSEDIDAIVVAVERSSIKRLKDLAARYKFKKIADVVVGGKTRFESVKNCLENIGGFFDVVLIHDGCRPFLERSVIRDSIRLADKYGACVVAVPETDTVKLADSASFVRRTLNRNEIYRAQTPQVFRCDLIMKAYELGSGRGMTDDAQVMELFGKRVKILEGSYRNIKITTREDLKIAEALL